MVVDVFVAACRAADACSSASRCDSSDARAGSESVSSAERLEEEDADDDERWRRSGLGILRRFVDCILPHA